MPTYGNFSHYALNFSNYILTFHIFHYHFTLGITQFCILPMAGLVWQLA